MSLSARQAPLGAKTLAERHAAHVAHHELPESRDFAKGVKRQDSRMRELSRDACLAPESLARFVRVGEVGTQHLDGDESFERALAGEIHRSHPAAPKLAHNLIL